MTLKANIRTPSDAYIPGMVTTYMVFRRCRYTAPAGLAWSVVVLFVKCRGDYGAALSVDEG